MSDPKVTVLMAVYNGGRYLRQAIDSILGQTFEDFEFVIINDGSTDDTPNILGTYDDPRIVVINQKNMGLAKSLNRGLGMARCEYIARMDGDDISLPERLEKQVEFMDAHPGIGVLGTGFQVIDERGKKLEAQFFPEDHDFIVWLLFFCNPIVHSTVMMRKVVVDEIGGYDPDVPQSQDYDLWCRLSGTTRFSNLQSEQLLLRKHGSSLSFTLPENQLINAVMVCHKLIVKQLGAEVSDETIYSMWAQKFKKLKDVSHAGKIIIKLFWVFRKRGMPQRVRKMIRKDVFNRLQHLVRRHMVRKLFY